MPVVAAAGVTLHLVLLLEAGELEVAGLEAA
jgi:hypothetical protein